MFETRGLPERRNERVTLLHRDASRRVWVDLAIVYPRPRGRAGRARPDPAGVDLTARVPGDLMWWCRATTGEWVGWCCVQIATGAGAVSHVWQYVPAAALAPRDADLSS